MDHQWKFEQTECCVQNMASWLVINQHDKRYLIQVSWPLEWQPIEEPSAVTEKANAIYIVDGNAMMLSATDIVRRRRIHKPKETPTIIIGISYPLTQSVYSSRRSHDLTPPCPKYATSEGPNGQPHVPEYGGADDFLHFITKTVHHFLISSIFPHVSIHRTALFGHSFGALFALHALYTAPMSFNAYLAASPSIWWNDGYILQEEDQFYNMPESDHQPKVWMAYGSLEQSPLPQKDQSPEEYEKRLAIAKERRMGDNCDQMFARLLQSGRVHSVVRRRYEDEDHGSVIAGALSGAIFYFLDQDADE
ncbi:esterase [Penicillium paradoxum]|uniref:esterase n=1 Tax=Penicillium paradoxum TaxID=176176 RepID=UPI0025490159|nr:esterase [Penicillium paradoxum]KAJ5787562.1 esterase [Penicillium paradoxum]